jgi:hypothetical protein
VEDKEKILLDSKAKKITVGEIVKSYRPTREKKKNCFN